MNVGLGILSHKQREPPKNTNKAKEAKVDNISSSEEEEYYDDEDYERFQLKVVEETEGNLDGKLIILGKFLYT